MSQKVVTRSTSILIFGTALTGEMAWWWWRGGGGGGVRDIL